MISQLNRFNISVLFYIATVGSQICNMKILFVLYMNDTFPDILIHRDIETKHIFYIFILW